MSKSLFDARRDALLQFVRTQRARFVQAYAALQWLGDRSGLVMDAKKALKAAQQQSTLVDLTQDRLYFMHGGLFGARQPQADIATALDVLTGAGYAALPRGIRNCGLDADLTPLLRPPNPAAAAAVEACIRRALACREAVPAGFSSVQIRAARLVLAARGRFELTLTLDGRSLAAPWLAVRVSVAVTARRGEAVAATALDAQRAAALRDVVQRGMD
ncbi:unnamed protein product, partial [Phaeothamnion confervicola]